VSELASRYKDWIEAVPGKGATRAFTAMVRTAMRSGYLLPEHLHPSNAPAEQVLIWVRRRLGRPDYEVIE